MMNQSMTKNLTAGILVACVGAFTAPGYSTSPLSMATKNDEPITRNTFRNVAKHVAPAVVNIKIKSNIVFGKGRMSRIPPQFGFDDDMREYLEKLFENQAPYLPPEQEEEFRYSRTGSGVIVRADGYVITSNHVVEQVKDEDIEVSLPDGRAFSKVKVIGNDRMTDLAVMKIEDAEAKNLPAIEWGDSDNIEVGDIVVAIGNPLEFNNSVSEGIVSAKHRTIKKAIIEDLIQTTAMINPGNSGGALVDLDGKLIGINMAIATNSGMWSGLGFAIPAKTAKDVSDQIIDRGKVARGFLGIGYEPVTPTIAEQIGYDKRNGVIVSKVTQGSAADKVGLQVYDIIAQVDEKGIRERDDLQRYIASRNAGEKVKLKVFRDEGQGKLAEKTIDVVLDERPRDSDLRNDGGSGKNAPALPEKITGDGMLGVRVDPRTDGKGVVVTEVTEGSRAAKAGLRKGDIVLEVNRHKVNSAQELKDALKESKKDGHLFFVERDGVTSILPVGAN